MIIFEVSPLKGFLIDQLIEHKVLDLRSWLNYLSLTLTFSIILLPIQNTLYNIINKMNFVNKVFLANENKMNEEVMEAISKVKMPTKKKIFFILLMNVIAFGFFISVIAEFKLNISDSVFLPIKIVFLLSAYFFIYRFFKQKIKNSTLNILISFFFLIVLFLYVKKEVILFIIIQNIILYIFRMLVKRKKLIINDYSEVSE